MSWVDQCILAFKTKAEAIYWKNNGKVDFKEIIKDLSKESGIPYNTLSQWMNDQKINDQKISDERPLCRICHKNNVEIDPRDKKLYPSRRLCGTCRKTATLAKKMNNYSEGILSVCPKCDHIYFINRRKER